MYKTQNLFKASIEKKNIDIHVKNMIFMQIDQDISYSA